jgi:hypothetical protein
MNLESRLSKLEQQHSPSRGYIVLLGADETTTEATAAAGIQPNERDQIIFVRRGIAGDGCAIDPTKRLVSCFAVAS